MNRFPSTLFEVTPPLRAHILLYSRPDNTKFAFLLLLTPLAGN